MQPQIKAIYPLLTLLSALCLVFSINFLQPPSNKHQGKTALTPSQTLLPNLFLTEIPKPINSITLRDLPSNQVPFDIIQYQNRVIYSSLGEIIDFDTSSNQILHYSHLPVARCFGNKVISNEYLYVSCDKNPKDDQDFGPQTLWKIDLADFSVKAIYDQRNGINAQYNFLLEKDGNSLWIGHFNGLLKFDTITNQATDMTPMLGIFGSQSQVNKIIQDDSHVWFYIPAHAYSSGGITLFDKTTNTFTPFNVDTFKPSQTDRFDLRSWKLTTQGLYISYNEGDFYKESLYDYQMSSWRVTRSIKSDQLNQSSQDFPSEEDIKTTSSKDGLVQLNIAEINGRTYLALSPEINGQRYALTNTTIDSISKDQKFPTIRIKFGADITNYSPSSPDPDHILFYIDPATEKGFVLVNDISAFGQENDSHIYFLDLIQNKIIKHITASDNRFFTQIFKDAVVNAVNGEYQIQTNPTSPTFLTININTQEYKFSN